MSPMARSNYMLESRNMSIGIGSRQQQRRRSDYSDLGCTLPEDSTNLDYSSFLQQPQPLPHEIDNATSKYDNDDDDDDDDDEKTVVMGNHDSRPKHIGKLEKLHSLSNITQEEKDARDRQLIEMYTRPRPGDKRCKNKKKAKSSPSRMLNVYNPHAAAAAGAGGAPQGGPAAPPLRPKQSLPPRRFHSNKSLLSNNNSKTSGGTSGSTRSVTSFSSSTRSVASQVPEQFYPYYDLVVTDSPLKKVTESPASISKSSVMGKDAAAIKEYQVIIPPFSPRKKKTLSNNSKN